MELCQRGKLNETHCRVAVAPSKEIDMDCSACTWDCQVGKPYWLVLLLQGFVKWGWYRYFCLEKQ